VLAPFMFYTFSYRYASAGFVGMLIALVPLATAARAHTVLDNKPLHTAKVTGLSLAFSGVVLLLLSGASGLDSGGRVLLAATLTLPAWFRSP
jgi:drug/metabolite transporter (DMT)-like permease